MGILRVIFLVQKDVGVGATTEYIMFVDFFKGISSSDMNEIVKQSDI
jgi:hypothetical protein